ncbi:TIGR03086 family protein [Friedmanniella luteola]|uniref:TIGR03086 family protein n=1 Tax=Friedmanniella luteola TaxID=546871 RepID=A0A1H1WFI3_9ACTN|nr:TIGR03086 family metal-binding protein [Friedmanniella luteola]SDS95853.1 TIGR03086 family protein [Friedmanniella luteola]
MSLPSEPGARHRAVAAGFTARVWGTSGWDAPAPVPGWRARDVVGHLVGWFPEFLTSATGLVLDRGPSPEEDPVAAWQVHADAVQRLLDGPEAATPFQHPMVGAMPLPDAVDRFYTSDVFLHTWDLARATGQDERLDAQTCAEMLDGMTPIEALLRSSGQYGPAVTVPDDADVQTRLLAFIGRDPLGSRGATVTG